MNMTHLARSRSSSIVWAALPVAMMHGAGAFAQAPLQAGHAPTEEQAPSSKPADSVSDVLLQDIVVTATRRSENLSKVPLSLSAFSSDQLEAQQFRNIGSLNFSMPNVQLNDNGAQPGYANFSIRGLGLNSSIPSTDPTVGVFLDGIYQGVSAGLVFDNFDIEAIEVLRGPQGVLFGRNVTAGAVLIRTKRPTADLEASGRIAVESGPKYIATASVSGPLVGDKILAKVAGYYAYDKGYFDNTFNGNDHLGRQKQFLIRPMLEFKPSEGVDLLLRYEHGRQTGDGAVGRTSLSSTAKTTTSS